MCIAWRKEVSREETMKVLLTGGSGNLGQTLVPMLLDQGDTPVILDVRAPRDLKKGAVFIEGSILDRATLTETFRGCDCIVHIAAWHGIHEDRGEKNAYDFFDVNVRGTFEVFEAAASVGIGKIIFISGIGLGIGSHMGAPSRRGWGENWGGPRSATATYRQFGERERQQ